MNALIERIDSAVQNNTLRTSSFIHKNDVLVCCKAEIERLLLANETLKGLCEDYQVQIKQPSDAYDIPLYTTPPNIQHLICEIDGIPNLNNDSMWKAHVMFTLDKWRAK